MARTWNLSVEIEAPLDHVAATLVRTDLDALRFYDRRVVSVESNGLPDGAAGQVVTITAKIYGQRSEAVQTTLVSELPGLVVDRTELSTLSMLLTSRLTELFDGKTRLDQQVTVEVPRWRVLTRLATSLYAGSQLHTAALRFKEFAELTSRAP